MRKIQFFSSFKTWRRKAIEWRKKMSEEMKRHFFTKSEEIKCKMETWKRNNSQLFSCREPRKKVLKLTYSFCERFSCFSHRSLPFPCYFSHVTRRSAHNVKTDVLIFVMLVIISLTPASSTCVNRGSRLKASLF